MEERRFAEFRTNNKDWIQRKHPPVQQSTTAVLPVLRGGSQSVLDFISERTEPYKKTKSNPYILSSLALKSNRTNHAKANQSLLTYQFGYCALRVLPLRPSTDD